VYLGLERFTLAIDGATLDPHAAHTRVDLVLAIDEATVQRFLDDWMGPGRWLPRFEPRGGVLLLTDPRLVRRLGMVSGSIELAIVDFEGGRAGMTLAAGARATRDQEGDEDAACDVVVELSTRTFELLLAGTLRPDEAIIDKHVTVRGKTLVAMQFALALVPFFPAG
jgi:hypothetical protein